MAREGAGVDQGTLIKVAYALLHRVVAACWPTFRVRAEHAGGLAGQPSTRSARALSRKR